MLACTPAIQVHCIWAFCREIQCIHRAQDPRPLPLADDTSLVHAQLAVHHMTGQSAFECFRASLARDPMDDWNCADLDRVVLV